MTTKTLAAAMAAFALLAGACGDSDDPDPAGTDTAAPTDAMTDPGTSAATDPNQDAAKTPDELAAEAGAPTPDNFTLIDGIEHEDAIELHYTYDVAPPPPGVKEAWEAAGFTVDNETFGSWQLFMSHEEWCALMYIDYLDASASGGAAVAYLIRAEAAADGCEGAINAILSDVGGTVQGLL